MQNNFFPNNYTIINKAGLVGLTGVLFPHSSAEATNFWKQGSELQTNYYFLHKILVMLGHTNW